MEKKMEHQINYLAHITSSSCIQEHVSLLQILLVQGQRNLRFPNTKVLGTP